MLKSVKSVVYTTDLPSLCVIIACIFSYPQLAPMWSKKHAHFASSRDLKYTPLYSVSQLQNPRLRPTGAGPARGAAFASVAVSPALAPVPGGGRTPSAHPLARPDRAAAAVVGSCSRSSS